MITKPSAASQPSASSSSFGFWSLNNSSSFQSSPFSYNKKKTSPLQTTTVVPMCRKQETTTVVVEEEEPVQELIQKKKVSFQLQCQVHTFEVVSIDEDFENSEVDDEDYWEQLGEDYWYQSHDFVTFKKDRRTLVDRIRTIGVQNAKGHYCMEGLEYFLTLQARETHKDRVLDGWVSVLEIQHDLEKEDEADKQHMADLIASKYLAVSKDCIQDAHQRGVETAQEIQQEDEKLVASIPKSPQPSKPKVETTKVKAFGVWGNTWSSAPKNNNTNSNNTTNSFSTFQKIRPFPRQ